jgi:hypothetical protein
MRRTPQNGTTMKSLSLSRALATAVAVAVVGLTASACTSLDSSGTAADRAANAEKHHKNQIKAAEVKDGPHGTPAQEQAYGSANDYLDGQAFSKDGLVKQLQFEDFKKADAVWAVNHVKTSWNNQAALSAKQYLNGQHFSRQGLIDQLKFEGYTTAQATYGVNKAGL